MILRMYELTIESVFAAAHSIVIRGVQEPLHGHNWHVTACLQGPTLDEDGLLLDFHEAERVLAGVVGPFVNRSLNDVPPFDRVNPTAEHVARHVAESLSGGLGLDPNPADGSDRGAAVRVAWVRVSEAPGCHAVYRPALSDGADGADE